MMHARRSLGIVIPLPALLIARWDCGWCGESVQFRVALASRVEPVMSNGKYNTAQFKYIQKLHVFLDLPSLCPPTFLYPHPSL